MMVLVTHYGDSYRIYCSYSDPRNLVTSYVRNGFGEAIQKVSPDTGTTTYVRDSRGLITQMTDGRNVVTNYAYDAAGRIISKSYPAAPTENVTYGWDATAGGNKGVGQLTSLSGQTRKYDGRGNIVSTTHTIELR